MDLIPHCVKKSRWKLESRATTVMLVVLGMLSLLGWIYLSQASYVATTSRHVQQLEAEKARLQQENLELMAEIAELESVTRLTARAREMGLVMVAPEDVEFVVISDVPAGGDELAGGSEEEGLLSIVAAQFEAWARTGGR